MRFTVRCTTLRSAVSTRVFADHCTNASLSDRFFQAKMKRSVR